MSKPATATKELDWQALIETAITAPGNVGNTYNRFYTYSFTNQMLLLMQGVQEPVATYKRWQSLGRQVVKGAKAKEIVRPIIFDKDRDGNQLEKKRVLFKPSRCLFTVSETTGADLPPVEPASWNLATALDELEIKRVPFTMLDGNVQGFSYERNYALNPVAAHPMKTTMHELAHIVSGHTTGDRHAEYQAHRGTFEFEAEGSAYLAMNELELLTDDMASVSRGYVQNWLRGSEPPVDSIKQVFRTTDQILRAGRLATGAVELAS